MKSIDDEIFEVNLLNAKVNKMLLGNEILDPQVTNIMSVDSITN